MLFILDLFSSWKVSANHPVGWEQVGLGNPLYIFRAYPVQVVQITGKPIIRGEHIRVSQPEGLVGNIFAAIGKQSTGLFNSALYLCLGDRFIL